MRGISLLLEARSALPSKVTYSRRETSVYAPTRAVAHPDHYDWAFLLNATGVWSRVRLSGGRGSWRRPCSRSRFSEVIKIPEVRD